jgi:excinuclease UvrABC ATPase subunit
VLVLDEPTTGLHMDDVGRLIDLMDALVDRGRTLIVIEHDLDIVAIVFAGPPRDLVAAEGSVTGRHLAERLAAA